MGQEAKTIATYMDLLNLPDNIIGEIIAGELVTSPRSSLRHAQASSIIGVEIAGPFNRGKGGPGGWWILDEPEIHLKGDILVPDLAGWRKDLVPQLPTETSYCEIPPQWICEVLSPSTARIDRVKKLPIYLREKVEHVWLLNPVEKTLEIYERSENRWYLLNTFGGNNLVRAAPFDAIEIDLGSLWLPD